MDEILAKAGSQAVTFAIRSGISIASTYAIKNVAKFLTKVPVEDRKRLSRTKQKLQTRIEIVSSAIDLIKLVAARGNTNLESTLKLTKDLKEEIDEFDERVKSITDNYDDKQSGKEVGEVEAYMQDLLERIEEAIPLINLSLTTSGANLNGSLPAQVSPGRLLQASDMVNKSNEQFKEKQESLQVGPLFQVTLYSIFYHRGRMVNNRLNEISWKETYPRANVSIMRLKHEHNPYAYKLKIEESHDDGRYHDEPQEVQEYDIGLITRLFFSASGKLLKLEDRSTPVLVLKINKSFADGDPDSGEDDVEWLAFGEYEQLYGEEESSDEESSDTEDELRDQRPATPLHKSLSLLEYVLRLCVLQSNDQLSILEIDDERLALYLQDENKEQSVQMETFESQGSTPISKKKIKNDLTSRLQKMSLTPSTPRKLNEKDDVDESPLPGEIHTMTPWEKDKLLKIVEQTPSTNRRR